MGLAVSRMDDNISPVKKNLELAVLGKFIGWRWRLFTGGEIQHWVNLAWTFKAPIQVQKMDSVFIIFCSHKEDFDYLANQGVANYRHYYILIPIVTLKIDTNSQNPLQ